MKETNYNTNKHNPQKKLCEGIYWAVNNDWIKQQICKMYYIDNDDNMGRPLIIIPIKDAYSYNGSVIFSLQGSPPKGYALYNYCHRRLIFISQGLETTKKFNHIILMDNYNFTLPRKD